MLAESRWIDAMSEQAGRTESLGERPVVVLTAGEALAMPEVSAEGNAAMWRIWLELQGELAGLSTNSDHRVVEGAGHYIHVDRPEAVVRAFGDVVGAVRDGERFRGPEGQGSEVIDGAKEHRRSCDKAFGPALHYRDGLIRTGNGQ